jgi:beta-fructofuranosidase
VGRTWPGAAKPPEAVLDDADAGVTYTGTWNTVTDDTTFFDSTCHYSTATASSLEATFTGTSVAWYGLKNTDLGKADVYIDDKLVGEAIDCYAPERVTSWLFGASDLADGVHLIRLVARGDKNAASTGSAILHDYFIAG